MDYFKPSEMKTILHSKRANIYYLEHCRILVNGGRVEYAAEAGKKINYYNIPIANTTVVLLGNGTSVTQAAVRDMAKAGVLIGFCGGGGVPLFSAMEQDTDIVWFQPQSEYRPTQYLQQWAGFWYDPVKRLKAAVIFQDARISLIKKCWEKTASDNDSGFEYNERLLGQALDVFESNLKRCVNTEELLLEEARLTKNLYRLAAKAVEYGDFTRSKRGEGADSANRFLDHGNYLAYGLGATASWVLGLPHGFSVLHGKTRRGGLVFDIADIVKDALIMPNAFISAMKGETDQQFRQSCIDSLVRSEALDYMIDTVKYASESAGRTEV